MQRVIGFRWKAARFVIPLAYFHYFGEREVFLLQPEDEERAL